MAKGRNSGVKSALLAVALLGSTLAQKMPIAVPMPVDPNGYTSYGGTPTNTTYKN